MIGKRDEDGMWHTAGGRKRNDQGPPAGKAAKQIAAQAKKEAEKRSKPPTLPPAVIAEKKAKSEKRQRQKQRRANEREELEDRPVKNRLGREALAQRVRDMESLPKIYDSNPGAVWEQALSLYVPACDDTDSDMDEEDYETVEVPKPEILSATLVNVVAQATVADAELRVALKTWLPRLLHTAFSAGSGGVTSFRALYVLQTILRTHAGSLGGPATTVWISRLGFPAPVKLWVLSQVAIACPENALGLMFDTSSLTDPFLADPHMTTVLFSVFWPAGSATTVRRAKGSYPVMTVL